SRRGFAIIGWRLWGLAAHGTKLGRLRLFQHVGIEHAVLLQIMRNRVLRQQRRLQADFRSHPLAFAVGRVLGVAAGPAAAELRAKSRALNLVKLAQPAPGLVASRPRDVNLQADNRHNLEWKIIHHQFTFPGAPRFDYPGSREVSAGAGAYKR